MKEGRFLAKSVTTVEAQPVRAVEPTFDLGTSAPQPHADLLTPQTPAFSLPSDRVVRSDRVRHPYAENSLQVLGALYMAVRVAALRGLYTEALAPEWPLRRHKIQIR
jgi:hypothetical protein